MSRSQPYRSRLPVHIMQLLDVASRITLFLVGQAGPLSFTFKDRLDNKYRTQIGPDLRCSCSPNRNDQCIHTAYVLLRIFRLSVDNPLIWQAAYVDSQLEDLLAGKHSQVQQRSLRPHFPQMREEWPQLPSEMLQRRQEEWGREKQEAETVAEKMKLEQGAVCPVCQEEMREDMCLSWCRSGCGNNFHLECLKVWARHRSQEGTSVNCPMCRSKFPTSFLSELERQERQWARRQSEKMRVIFDCSGCGLKGIPLAPHKCILCTSYELCQPCYSSGKHIKHPFVRQDSDGRWRGADERRAGQLKLKDYIESKRKEKFNQEMLLKLRKIEEDPAKLFDFVAAAYPYVSRYISDHIDPLRKMDFSPSDLRCQKCGSTKMLFLRRLPCGHFIDHECLKDAVLKDKFYCAEDGSQFLKGFENLRRREKENDDKKQQQYLNIAPELSPSPEFSAAHLEQVNPAREFYNFVGVQEEEPTLSEMLSNRGSSERRPDQLRTRIASNIIREQRLTSIRQQPQSTPPAPPTLPLPARHTPPRAEIRVRNVGASTKTRKEAESRRPLSRERGVGKKKEDLQFMIEALIGRKLK